MCVHITWLHQSEIGHVSCNGQITCNLKGYVCVGLLVLQMASSLLHLEKQLSWSPAWRHARLQFRIINQINQSKSKGVPHTFQCCPIGEHSWGKCENELCCGNAFIQVGIQEISRHTLQWKAKTDKPFLFQSCSPMGQHFCTHLDKQFENRWKSAEVTGAK